MTTAASDPQIVPRQPASMLALRAADQDVAVALEPFSATTPGASTAPSGASSPAGAARWPCAPCPPNPLTVARYLAAGSGASIAKAHQWAGHNSPCRERGVRESLKGWRRRLAKPQRQTGALTAAVLAVIRLTAVQSRRRSRGVETPVQAEGRGRFDLALACYEGVMLSFDYP